MERSIRIISALRSVSAGSVIFSINRTASEFSSAITSGIEESPLNHPFAKKKINRTAAPATNGNSFFEEGLVFSSSVTDSLETTSDFVPLQMD